MAKNVAVALLKIHREENLELRGEAKITLASLVLNVNKQIEKENIPGQREQLRNLLFSISSEGHLTPHIGWAAITKWANTTVSEYDKGLIDGKFNLHTSNGVRGKALENKTPIN